MIHITPTLAIDEREVMLDFIHASGPGGQNVNKVATAVQLRFDVRNSTSLPEDVQDRLARLAGRRMSKDGILIIEARQHRTQTRNREEAIDRLIALIRRAAETPKVRRRSKPSRAARARRLESKRRRAQVKRMRRRVSGPDA
jgi:ribosome-associated protein